MSGFWLEISILLSFGYNFTLESVSLQVNTDKYNKCYCNQADQLSCVLYTYFFFFFFLFGLRKPQIALSFVFTLLVWFKFGKCMIIAREGDVGSDMLIMSNLSANTKQLLH